MLKTIKGFYLSLAWFFDPALEGDPYEKESLLPRRKTRHEAKNRGWSFRRWARA